MKIAVRWREPYSDGEYKFGKLVAFVHDSVRTYGMVLSKGRFMKVHYDQLETDE